MEHPSETPLLYTKQHLCQVASEAGYTMTPRRVDDWVAQGLLDRPTKKGLGRGRGTVATWPAHQKNLLIALLKHYSDVSELGPLCNMPVWIWLGWGEEYVPLRQVRRAIVTWGRATRTGSHRQGRAGAERMVHELAHPEATTADKQALVASLTKAHVTGRFQPETIHPLVQRVFDPEGSGQPRGPIDASVTPERFIDLVQRRLEALQRLQSDADDSVSDWELRSVRHFYLTGWGHYRLAQPRLQADPQLGQLFTEGLNEMVNTACVTVLTILGNIAEDPRKGLGDRGLTRPPLTFCEHGCGREAFTSIGDLRTGRIHVLCQAHYLEFARQIAEAHARENASDPDRGHPTK